MREFKIYIQEGGSLMRFNMNCTNVHIWPVEKSKAELISGVLAVRSKQKQ